MVADATVSAAVYGCQGTELLADERDFFRETKPFGFILFGRNCAAPDQIRKLADALRAAAGHDALVFIDQEGGRVSRLNPPHWRVRPPARLFGDIFESDADKAREAAYLCSRLMAHDLRALGINADCAPVLDVPVPGAHDIIGDRAFSLDPSVVIALGRAAIEGFLDGGVLPVIKHIPGHGRAASDSHEILPRVDAPRDALSATDFVTFRSLNHAPMAMTAHVVYEAIDDHRPATTSPKVIRDVIRGEIGFDGLLLSDDLSMGALDGPLGVRAKAALFAGCDVALHCNGRLDEMKEIAEHAKNLSGPAARRAEAVLGALHAPSPFDADAAEQRFVDLVGAAA